MLNVKRGGFADSDATDVAVNPNGTPLWLAVMMATPAACRRNISRKVPSKVPSSVATAIQPLAARACHGPYSASVFRLPPVGHLFPPGVMSSLPASCALTAESLLPFVA